jgi:uncharacterized alkaline shock family protein YloU
MGAWFLDSKAKRQAESGGVPVRWRREGGKLRIHEEVVAAVAQLALEETAGVARTPRRPAQLVRPRGISVRGSDGLRVYCQIDLERGAEVDAEAVAEAASARVQVRLSEWLGLEASEVTVRVRSQGTRKRGEPKAHARTNPS